METNVRRPVNKSCILYELLLEKELLKQDQETLMAYIAYRVTGELVYTNEQRDHLLIARANVLRGLRNA